MSRQHYFIVGFPRSRTAWLSALLTWDNSFCYHEAIARCGSMEEFKALLDKVPERTRFIGDSDPALGIIGLPAIDHFPKAKFVFIFRHMEESLAAEWRAINDELGPQPPEAFNQLRADLAKVEKNLDAMWKALPDERRMFALYEDMDREETIRAIWKFCIPGVQFQEQRYWAIDNFRVTQMFRKVLKKHPPTKFQEWAKTNERVLENQPTIA